MVRKAYADTPLGQLHYLESHPSQASAATHAPLLLLHMSASSSKCYHKMMPALSALGYTCYAPDMPGFGSSFDPSDDPPSISWYAGLYYDTFSQFEGFAQGCHILGHHSGGVIGIELAAAYPDFVKTLTCIGPTVMSLEDRQELSKTFLDPFNKPAASGSHLLETWNYLRWEGIPENELDLMQREALDHIRAWKGRSQIYRCVWDYDCEDALGRTAPHCRILGLCAQDDVLWPYLKSFIAVDRPVETGEISGGNFGPDLDSTGIIDAFVAFLKHV